MADIVTIMNVVMCTSAPYLDSYSTFPIVSSFMVYSTDGVDYAA